MMVDVQKIQKEKPIAELLEFCIINVDKPAGCTSFDVVEKIMKIFSVRKTGHFGTLDPMVTGVCLLQLIAPANFQIILCTKIKFMLVKCICILMFLRQS